MVLNVKRVSPGQCGGYYITESDHPTFFPGRCADIYVDNLSIGTFGIIHPNVLEKFEIGYPCSFVEMNIEHFL